MWTPSRRGATFPAMRAHLLVLGAVTACGLGKGGVDAAWQVAGERHEVTTEGRSGWCPAASMILVEGTEGDRAVGVHWHYDSLVPATWQLEPPTVADSVVTGASAAVRYVHLDEVRGYRSLSGELTVTAIDSSTVSGRVTAVLQRVGEPDSTALTMTFDRVPLVVDSTLCPPPRLASDTLAPTAAPGP
jgi:hypothetical protein